MNGSRIGVSKFNLALEISVRKLVQLEGQPELDAAHDDSMHNFQLAKPVTTCINRTDELVWPDAEHRVLHVLGRSSHLSFELFANFVHAFGGKHAKKRFEGGIHIRE